MAVDQAASPATENSSVADTAAKGDSALTGTEAEGAASSTKGAPTGLPHAWMGGLTAEQKADADLVKSLSKFEKGIPDLARSYAELEKKQSQMLAIPNEKASPEDRTRFQKALGVPEKPEDYKLDKVELKHITPDTQRVSALLAVAQKNGVSQTAMNELYKAFMLSADQDFATLKKVGDAAREKALVLLKGELGARFDEAIVRKDRALEMVGKKNPEAMGRYIKWADTSGAGNEVANIEMWAVIGELIGEHAFVDGSRGAHMETGTFGTRTDQQLASALYDKSKKGT